jgi:hypothetical protein
MRPAHTVFGKYGLMARATASPNGASFLIGFSRGRFVVLLVRIQPAFGQDKAARPPRGKEKNFQSSLF